MQYFMITHDYLLKENDFIQYEPENEMDRGTARTRVWPPW